MIFIIEDNFHFSKCLARYCRPAKTKIFENAIEAVSALNEELPDLIFLDILLTGPDGFTFLNEVASYKDTSKIPIIIVSSLNFAGKDLTDYGVVGILNKDTLMPEDVRHYVELYSH